MAETRTIRFGLVQWGAGTDSPSRADFNEAFANVETSGAYSTQTLEANRPVPTKGRHLHLDTDTGKVLWGDGASWRVVGARVDELLAVPSATNKVPLTIRTDISHAEDMVRWGPHNPLGGGDETIKNYINRYGSIVMSDAGGSIGHEVKIYNDSEPNRLAALEVNKSFTTPGLRIGHYGPAGGEQDLLQIFNSSGSKTTYVDNQGDIRSERLTGGRKQPPFCKMVQKRVNNDWKWVPPSPASFHKVPIEIGRLPFPADFDEIDVDNLIKVNYAGWYQVALHVDWEWSPYGARLLKFIHRIGGGVEQNDNIDDARGGIGGGVPGGIQSQSVVGYTRIDSGDRVGIGVWQSSIEGLYLDGGSNTWMVLRWVAPV